MNEAIAIEHMEQALAQEHGLKVKTTNAEQYRQLCYRVREQERSLGVTRFDQLKFYVAPNNSNEVWIVLKNVETEETNEGSPDPTL